eukprot:4958118-Prymnesium_polylepis.1
MVVSEILGTLTTSESMCKYLSLYRPHVRTFGDDGERRVYMVPQRTEQAMALHAFDRRALSAPLATLLRTATSYGSARNRLVPTNEGGLNVLLHLYVSRRPPGRARDAERRGAERARGRKAAASRCSGAAAAARAPVA